MEQFTLGKPILSCENVSAGYDGVEVIKDINILEKDVLREGHITGQTIAIVGRSGRGKSTLFKILTGLKDPMNGEVLIADDNGEAKIATAGDIGFVDQKYTLFRHKTITQTFHYALRNADMTKKEKNELVESYLVNWWLSNQRDQYANELSGGQRQRVAIIEQLLSSKRFIIMDEPFSGLDVGNIDRLKEYFDMVLALDELNTIIFSTHELHLAVEFADSIYILGHEEEGDTTSTIVKHYDLKELGMAWGGTEDMKRDLAKEIKRVMLES